MLISWEYILLALIILPFIIAWGQTANIPRSQKMTRKEYRKLCKALRLKNDKLFDKIITQIIENHFLWIMDKDKLKCYFRNYWDADTSYDKCHFSGHIPDKEKLHCLELFGFH